MLLFGGCFFLFGVRALMQCHPCGERRRAHGEPLLGGEWQKCCSSLRVFSCGAAAPVSPGVPLEQDNYWAQMEGIVKPHLFCLPVFVALNECIIWTSPYKRSYLRERASKIKPFFFFFNQPEKRL